MLVSVEAPNGEGVSGEVIGGVLLAFPPGYDLEEPFTVLCEHTGKPIEVLMPWDCDIEIVS